MQFRFILVIVTTLLLGCDGSVRREGTQVPLLQVERTDVAGNRVWVLELDGVKVFDRTNRRLLRHVSLADWAAIGPNDGCAPDLVLDPSGAALVSSNVVPVIWRIEPQRFEVKQIFLRLDSDADKDVGFTALAVAQDGTLTASGATFASSWRIDLRTRSARRLDGSSMRRCEALT